MRETGIKVRRTKKFRSVCYDCFNSKELTWKAKGLYGYLATRPDNWIVYRKDLIERSLDGKHAFDTAIKELEKAGYVHRIIGKKDSANRFYVPTEYLIMDEPTSKEEAIRLVNEDPSFQDPDFQDADNLDTYIINKEDKKRKKITTLQKEKDAVLCYHPSGCKPSNKQPVDQRTFTLPNNVKQVLDHWNSKDHLPKLRLPKEGVAPSKSLEEVTMNLKKCFRGTVLCL